MKTIFLSHSGADTELARKLREKLLARSDAAMPIEVWFDKTHLKAGAVPWKDQLAAAIENCDAFMVLVGANGVINWVKAEVDIGMSRAVSDKIPMVPVLSSTDISSSALPAFVRSYQMITDPLNDAEAFEELYQALTDGEYSEPPTVDHPFVGLRAMEMQDSHLFFGRGAALDQLTGLMRNERLIAVVSDSGAGKSSLVRAGFAPLFKGGVFSRLDGENPPDEVRHVVSMLPGDDPMAGLRKGVNAAAVELGLGGAARASLRGRIDAGNLDELAYALNCDLPFEHVETLLIVDQAEEMLTQSSVEDREAFLKVLLHLTQAATFNIRVVLTVRVDFFNLFSAHDAFFRALTDRPDKTQLRLQKLSSGEIAEAVREPLKLAGYRDGEDIAALTAAIQKDVSDRPGDTALIQFALWSAWRNRSAKGGLTEAYIRIGGVHGALAVRADEIRKDLSADDQQRLGALFARLVRPSGTGGATARAVRFEELDAETRALAATMADEDHARLLQTTGEDVRLAHEALIRQWPWLQTEIEKNGDQLRLLHRLMESAADWEQAGRPDERLPQGAILGDYEALAERRSAWLSPDEKAFIGSAAKKRNAAEAEKVAEERAKGRAQKRFKRLAIGSAFIAVLSVIAAITSLFYYDKATKQEALALRQTTIALKQESIAKQNEAEAKKQEAIAQSETAKGRQNQRMALAALADSEFNAGRMPEAMFLSLAAWPREVDETVDLTSLSVALKTLVDASAKNNERTRLEGHGSSVTSADFSPDGVRLATATFDGTARIWDASKGAEITRIEGHEGRVRGVAFSPDGVRLATAGADGTARIWDVGTGAEITRLEGHEGWFNSVTFSPDGARLATAGGFGTAQIWDAATGVEIARLEGHQYSVESVAFSPDGARLATTSSDGTARIWDVTTGPDIVHLEGHELQVNSVAFSPDGTQLATASDDSTARIWDAAKGAEITRLVGHEEAFHSVAFSPDGTQLATASDDSTARIWDAAKGAEITRFEGHEEAVISVAFSPDGTRLATVSDDSTARIWDAATGKEMTRFEGHEEAVISVAFSPDGTRLATVSDDSTARIWDAATGKEIARLEGHDGSVNSVAFSPDGGQLATAGGDRTVRIWHAAAAAEITRLEGHEASLYGVAFSPDGTRLATASEDKTARIWDVDLGPGNFFALKCAELPTRTLPRILTQYNVDIGPPICSGTEPIPPLLPPKDKP